MSKLSIDYTDISGVFDLSGLNSLYFFSAGGCSITNIINLPITLLQVFIPDMQLTQTEADTIASTLVSYGLTDGILQISTQQGGSINISGAAYDGLRNNGWTIY